MCPPQPLVDLPSPNIPAMKTAISWHDPVMIICKQTEEYGLMIEDGDPPPRGKTKYLAKLPDGALSDLAKRIRPGQYVANLSAGSLGKLAGMIEDRGLRVVRRIGQGDSRGT